MAVFAQSPNAAHPIALPTTTPPVIATSYKSLPAWVIAADAYVHVVKGVATIDAAATANLDATTLANAQLALAKFNALPLDTRVETPYAGAGIHVFGKPAPITLPGAGSLKVQLMVSAACIRGSYMSVQWWGLYFKFSECATNLLEGGPAAIGTIIGTIGAVVALGGPAAWAAAGAFIVVIGGLVASAGAVIWLDDNFICNNRGVSISFNWLPFVGGFGVGC
jgi:hypothetical protein